MKIIHAQTTTKDRIRTVPVTEHYLIRDNSREYQWDTTNIKWRFIMPTGGTRCMITNIKRDYSDHSSDLWLYTNLTQKETVLFTQRGSDFGTQLIEENSNQLNRHRKWYIKQFKETDRVGIRRFGGLPLTAFWDMWRKVIPITDIHIYGLGNTQMKVVYEEYNFNVFLKWPAMQNDFVNSRVTTQLENNITALRVSEVVLPWLHRSCRGGIILFSDYDTMFPDFEDEFTYITDII
jgi:hypothetical protein